MSCNVHIAHSYWLLSNGNAAERGHLGALSNWYRIIRRDEIQYKSQLAVRVCVCVCVTGDAGGGGGEGRRWDGERGMEKHYY